MSHPSGLNHQVNPGQAIEAADGPALEAVLAAAYQLAFFTAECTPVEQTHRPAIWPAFEAAYGVAYGEAYGPAV